MISATSSATATDTASGQATVQINQTFDDFLQLLVTQLKNQDPVSPMDPTEFTNQLVSFSQVEQQIHTNQNLEELIALQSDTWLGQPLDYLGQSVEVVGGTFTYDDEPVEMSYGVSSGAAGVVVQIVNSAGTTVYQEAGSTTAGRHTLTWDGTTSDGDYAPPGLYRVVASAVTSDGEMAELATATQGVVTGVESLDGETRLLIGGVAIDPADIIAVRQTDEN
ncbi:MAG: flagellar hook assembly protein FlgD [Rhodospirillaceae bacterium]|nr:flagellar hook assembly protein FlgD [Rhodospirillaceae bacterium]